MFYVQSSMFNVQIPVVSFRSPLGYSLNIFSSIHLLASTGESFQPLLQVETISTKLEPKPFMLASKALRIALFAFLMLATVYTLWRVT